MGKSYFRQMITQPGRLESAMENRFQRLNAILAGSSFITILQIIMRDNPPAAQLQVLGFFVTAFALSATAYVYTTLDIDREMPKWYDSLQTWLSTLATLAIIIGIIGLIAGASQGAGALFLALVMAFFLLTLRIMRIAEHHREASKEHTQEP